MESPLGNENIDNVALTSGSNLFTDTIELPDDTFRMGLSNYSDVGENITVDDRAISIDSISTASIDTPVLQIITPFPTPDIRTPEKSPPISETPKLDEKTDERKQTLLKLSLTKKSDNDIFVKPSPVEVMSPAKMLQFEIDAGSSATPTMKRAAIDFDFFSKNNFEEYFDDVPKAVAEQKQEKSYEETPVIVKANTVTHEIAYGTSDASLKACKLYLQSRHVNNNHDDNRSQTTTTTTDS